MSPLSRFVLPTLLAAAAAAPAATAGVWIDPDASYQRIYHFLLHERVDDIDFVEDYNGAPLGNTLDSGLVDLSGPGRLIEGQAILSSSIVNDNEVHASLAAYCYAALTGTSEQRADGFIYASFSVYIEVFGGHERITLGSTGRLEYPTEDYRSIYWKVYQIENEYDVVGVVDTKDRDALIGALPFDTTVTLPPGRYQINVYVGASLSNIDAPANPFGAAFAELADVVIRLGACDNPGDINGDGATDFQDLNEVVSNFNTVCAAQ